MIVSALMRGKPLTMNGICGATMLCGIAGVLLGLTSAHGAGGNALDRIDFGSTASETAHRMGTAESGMAAAGIGALRQTYRVPTPLAGEKPASNGDHLSFTMKVDPARQNYCTVRLWGGDQQTAGLWLQNTPRNYGAMDWNGTGGPPSFPNRFYYTTIPIPLSLTKGRNSAELVLYETNAPATRPGRPLYSAYTHSDPILVPDPRDVTGTPIPLTGQKPPEKLSADRIIDFLHQNRERIYGPGGYYDTILSRQIMPGTKGAPVEVIGLDLWTPIAGWNGASKTADDWRDQAGGHGHGGGYGTNPDELMSVLMSTFLLRPFTDANGRPVSGLDHFHDESIIKRLLLALDASTYLQSSDGSYNDQGEDKVHKTSAQGHWQGLTSTPRAEGHPYAGSRARGSGWSLTLEGANTATFGWTMLQLLNDPTAASLVKKSLAEPFDANLDGKPVKRAFAYERMLNNQLAYQAKIFGGGTVAQAMMASNSIYTNLVALDKLERIFPYPEKQSSFPHEAVASPVDVPYPALSPAQGVAFAKQSTGVDPVTKMMGNLYRDESVNYTISRAGFGEAGGTRSGGYDGRYGVILPWMGSRIAQVAAWDPAIDAPTLVKIRAQASAATDAYTRFVSPQEKFRGVTNEFTLAQEDFITYRDPYNGNANGNTFTVGSRYVVSDPAGGTSTPLSRRAAFLEALYGIAPADLQYLKDLRAYEDTLRALIDIDPAKMTALPGEPGQPNSAWVDVQTGATAAYYNGERFYMNANWRNMDIAGVGNVTNLARIHDTTAAIDRTALVFMPHDDGTVQNDGNLSGRLFEPWVARYGMWLVMGNPSSKPTTLRLPRGPGVALELKSNRRYTLGTALVVAPGESVVMVLPINYDQPVVPGPAQSFADGIYTMTAVHSGHALESALKQQPASGEPVQQWTFHYNDGFYTIKSVAQDAWLTCRDGLKLEKGAETANARWKAIANGIGYTFLNQATGLAIDVIYGSTEAGQGVTVHPYTGSGNQTWSLSVPKIGSSGFRPTTGFTH